MKEIITKKIENKEQRVELRPKFLKHEVAELKKQAKEMGFQNILSFVRYIVLLYLKIDNEELKTVEIHNELEEKFKNIRDKERFTCASLLKDRWEFLEKGQKHSLANHLKRLTLEDKSAEYLTVKIHGNINSYQKRRK